MRVNTAAVCAGPGCDHSHVLVFAVGDAVIAS
jgi:hypothetical protein